MSLAQVHADERADEDCDVELSGYRREIGEDTRDRSFGGDVAVTERRHRDEAVVKQIDAAGRVARVRQSRE